MSFSDMHTNTHTHTHTHGWAGVVSHLLDIVIKWEIAGWTYTHRWAGIVSHLGSISQVSS